MTPKTLLTLIILMLLGGCNLVAFPVLVFMPDKTIEPEFVFDPQARVLVMADAMHINLPQPQFKQRLCDEISAELLGYQLVKSVVPPQLARVTAAKLDKQYAAQNGSAAPVSQLLARTQADVAIYIEIRHFSLVEHGDYPLWRPSCSAAVRVVDASGKQLWPEGFSRGKNVNVTLPDCTGEDASMAITLSEEIAANMAEIIVKNFREYKVPRQGF